MCQNKDSIQRNRGVDFRIKVPERNSSNYIRVARNFREVTVLFVQS
jgi:hypothetical protein